MTVESVNILSSRCSRPYCICWPAVANGAEFRMITLNGGASFTTTANGGLMAVSSISFRNLSARSAKGVARHHPLQSGHWMRRVSNGVVNKEITVMTVTRKSKASKETSSPTVTDSSWQEKSAMPESMIQRWLMSYAGRPMTHGRSLKKFLWTVVTEGMWRQTSRKTSESSLKCPTLQTVSRDSCRNLCDGWSNELSHGSILADGSHVTMRF